MSFLIQLPGDRSRLIAVALDACALVASTHLAFRLTSGAWTDWIWLIPLVAFGTHALSGGYRATLVYRRHVQTISSALVSPVLATLPVYVLLDGTDTRRILFLFLTWLPLTCIGLIASRYLLRFVAPSVHSGIYRLVGVDERMRQRLLAALAQRPKFRPESVIDVDVSSPRVGEEESSSGIPSDIGTCDVVVYGREAVTSHAASRSLLALKVQGRDVYRDSVLYSELTGRLPVADEGGEHPIAMALEQASTGFHTRVVDMVRDVVNVAGGFVLLALFGIPMILIALAVKFSSPGPVLFRQERLGKDRAPFNLYKFRTMVLDAESEGPRWATQKDSRVTAIGGVMRDLHLDEIPQIFNLCKGELNFVGPRPMREHFAALLAEQIPDFDVRFLVKPGLTGWAQTLGPYGRDVNEQREKFEYDLFYVTNRHRLSDLMIIGMTMSKFMTSLTDLVHDARHRASDR